MKKMTRMQEKAMFANKNTGVTLKKMIGWPELPDPFTGKAPRHQEASQKAKMKTMQSNVSIEPPIIYDKYNEMFLKAGIFIALQGLTLTGFDEPHAIAKASIASLDETIKEYNESANIEDATITGIKSFVKNYISTKADNCIIESVISEYDIDNKFKAAIEGTVLMSTLSTIVEEFQ